MESNEKIIDAASTLLAMAVWSGLAGLMIWCFGAPLKISLGSAIVIFFLFVIFGNED